MRQRLRYSFCSFLCAVFVVVVAFVYLSFFSVRFNRVEMAEM